MLLVSAIVAHEVHGPAGAPWVVFVPGIGNDRSFWAGQAASLAGSHRVVLFDPFGHGDSPPPPEPCNFAALVNALFALMDHLGIERASLVGLGFGGSLALAGAIAQPGRIERVVACCCRPRQPDDRRAFWADRKAKAAEIGMARMADITVDRWLSGEFRASNPAIDLRLRAAMKRTSLAGYQAYVSAFIEMDLSDRLGEITCPVRLIAAENDHGGGPVPAMEAMALQIPECTLTVIPHAGHIVVAEAPEALGAILHEFLAATGCPA